VGGRWSDDGRAGLYRLLGAVLLAGLYVTVASPGISYGRNSNATNRGSSGVSGNIVLTANSIDAFGLTYVGTFTVPSPSGPVQVLRFTLGSGSAAGMRIAQRCAGGVATATAAPSASLGSTVFDAVRLAVTVNGVPLVFTVASPPTTPFPGAVLLQQVRLAATTLSTTQLNAQSVFTSAAIC
jgi:hypothetical protein